MTTAMTQLDLAYQRSPTNKPTVYHAHIARLLMFLSDRQWHTGRQIMESLEWTEDMVRHAAEGAGGKIISAPGCSLGYRLAAGCPVEEFMKEVDSRYMSQIQRMIYRLKEMRRAVHGNAQGDTLPLRKETNG